MTELRERAASVDALEKTNERLRAELDAAREKLLDAEFKNNISAVRNGEGRGEIRNRSMGTQTSSTDADWSDVDGNEHLWQKYKVLSGSYQELVLARTHLESKLRSSQKSNREWVGYADNLEKKILRLQGKLQSHVATSKHYPGGSSFEDIPSALPPSLSEPAPSRNGDTELETLRRELPNLFHVSEGISKLVRNAAVVTPSHKSSYLQLPMSAGSSERQQGDSDINNNAPLPIFRNSTLIEVGPSASDKAVSRISPKLLGDVTPALHQDPIHQVSSDSYHPGLTEDDTDFLPELSNREQVDIPPPVIKVEPSSDSPVVISSRSVKKKNSRKGTGSNDSASYANVKVEIDTSSPIGLAGFQGLLPQESMDLDEIGEKMNTPKKRRRAMHNAKLGSDKITHNRLPAERDQADGRQHIRRNSQPKGKPSALQPASPNKQILPRTSRQEREPKRRRVEDLIRGAVILGEDGENDVASRIGSDTEIRSEKFRKLPTNAVELQQRLSGLLEEPSPESEVLTPLRPQALSAATAQLRARPTPANAYRIATPTNRLYISGGTTQNMMAIPRDTPRSYYKPSTGKKRRARAFEDTEALEADGPDQEPLRARPLRFLGLEHFKINPSFNHGSDYAFTDVVRGRELRKCLPGCTKPECCGNKFRKFVEFAREHEEPTLSQEEQDARLLREYLGDNESQLQNMTEVEKEELLIQARTRDLANKASKHRHAYERRRSPPGFWRSDFPSTQELQTDRQEAANRERELVQQRYEEAMRPGGRWLFRDE